MCSATGFLTYNEFRDIIGQDCLNLGFDENEASILIAAVDTGNKGAITYSDLSRRLATADVGRSHDAMLSSSKRELQVREISSPKFTQYTQLDCAFRTI